MGEIDTIAALQRELADLERRQGDAAMRLDRARYRKAQLEAQVDAEVRRAALANESPVTADAEIELAELERAVGRPGIPPAKATTASQGHRGIRGVKGRLESSVEAFDVPIAVKRREIADAKERARPELRDVALAASDRVAAQLTTVSTEIATLERERAAADRAWSAVFEGCNAPADDPTWSAVRLEHPEHDLEPIDAELGSFKARPRLPGRAAPDWLKLTIAPVRVAGVDLGFAHLPEERYDPLALLAELGARVAGCDYRPRALLDPLPADQGEPGLYENAASGQRVNVGPRRARAERDALLPDFLGMAGWRRIGPLPADFVEEYGLAPPGDAEVGHYRRTEEEPLSPHRAGAIVDGDADVTINHIGEGGLVMGPAIT